jgi:hypothetical protein
LWRRGDGLFYEIPPLASDALLTTVHPLLESFGMIVEQAVFESTAPPSHPLRFNRPNDIWRKVKVMKQKNCTINYSDMMSSILTCVHEVLLIRREFKYKPGFFLKPRDSA